MKQITALLAAAMIMGAASGVQAETAPQEAPVTAPAVDPVKAALVERYFEVININEMMQSMLQSMGPAMTPQTGLTREEQAMLQTVLQESMDVVFPQMMEAYVVLYAEAFTLEELEGLVAFYESPVGRSMMEKTLVLTQQSGAVLERFVPMLEREMLTRICARTDCPTVEVTQ